MPKFTRVPYFLYRPVFILKTFFLDPASAFATVEKYQNRKHALLDSLDPSNSYPCDYRNLIGPKY
jgi:hypothetical protein